MSSTGPALDRSSLTVNVFNPTLLKRVAVAVTAVAVGAGLLLLPGWGEGEIGQMEIRELRGDVVLMRGGETLPVDGSIAIKPGDTIKAVDGRTAAELRLSGDRHALLAGRAAVTIIDEQTMSLQSGSVKAESLGGDHLSLRFDDIEIRPAGPAAVFRVDQGFGFARAASYSGTAVLSRPGERPLELDRLFEASVAGGELPLTTKPYRYDRNDDWDRQHLQSVMELDENLSTTAASLTNQLGKKRPGLEFFKGLAGRTVPYVRDFLRQPTQDLLIGFAIAQNSPGTPAKKAMREAFSLHDAGGRWGVVATILDTRTKPLLAQLNDIVLATGIADGDTGREAPDLTLAAGSAASTGSGTSGGNGDGGGGGTDPGTGTGGGTGGGGGDGGGGGGGGDDECAQDDAECNVEEIGGLVCQQGVCPSPSPSDGPLDLGILDGDDGGKKSSSGGSLGILGGILLVPIPLGAWFRRFSSRRTTRAFD